MNFLEAPAHTSSRGQAVPSGCRAGRRTTSRFLRGARAGMGFKRLEGPRVGKARDGRGVRSSDIQGTFKVIVTEPSDPGTRVSSTGELL